MYIEELIGADTVNTVPPATLEAFANHGRVRASLEADMPAAQEAVDLLGKLGISLDDITTELLDKGVNLFADTYAKLLQAIVRQSSPSNNSGEQAS